MSGCLDADPFQNSSKSSLSQQFRLKFELILIIKTISLLRFLTITGVHTHRHNLVIDKGELDRYLHFTLLRVEAVGVSDLKDQVQISRQRLMYQKPHLYTDRKLSVKIRLISAIFLLDLKQDHRHHIFLKILNIKSFIQFNNLLTLIFPLKNTKIIMTHQSCL